jgi:hypothetical protein
MEVELAAVALEQEQVLLQPLELLILVAVAVVDKAATQVQQVVLVLLSFVIRDKGALHDSR